MKVLTELLVPEIIARPFCSARFGSTVSQLGRVVSVDVRLVATAKMLGCVEVERLQAYVACHGDTRGSGVVAVSKRPCYNVLFQSGVENAKWCRSSEK